MLKSLSKMSQQCMSSRGKEVEYFMLFLKQNIRVLNSKVNESSITSLISYLELIWSCVMLVLYRDKYNTTQLLCWPFRAPVINSI